MKEMREILFRGKRKDNGEWVEGFYFKGFTGIPYIMTLHDHILGVTKYFEVISETVGQYTGLMDKNGVEVYEGDLLSYDCGDNDIEPCEVRFLNGRFVTQRVVSGTIDDVPYQTIKLAKVISNVFDNPDLLKEGVSG